MSTLFVLLFLISLVGLVVGLAKPALVKQESRQKTGLIFGGATILFFILMAATSPNKPEQQPTTSETTTTNEVSAPDSTNKTSTAPPVLTPPQNKTTTTSTQKTTNTQQKTTDTQQTNPAPMVVTPVPTPASAPINISGSSQQASQTFNLGQGLSIFKLSYTGSDNFSVWLVDSNGSNVSLLANTIGSFSGSKAVPIETAGSYLLNVQAVGPWTVNITQPRDSNPPSTTSFSGSTQTATNLFHLSSGLHVFKLNYTGEDNFSVWLIDHNGENVSLLANTIGSFNGSKAVGIDASGSYMLNVAASGSWSISIQ